MTEETGPAPAPEKPTFVIGVLPDSWARTLMEVIASEGDDVEKCLNHLQGLTVGLAGMAGVESDALYQGLSHHIEHFNKRAAQFCAEVDGKP